MPLEKTWGTVAIKERRRLSHKNSTKNTYHIALKLDPLLSYLPGDSIAILPKNPLSIVKRICSSLPFPKNSLVPTRKTGKKISLEEFLLEKANLTKPTKKLLEAFSLEEAIGSQEVIDIIKKGRCLVSAEEFASCLLPMTPRFYSIASSPTLYPKEAHLTVVLASFSKNGETRYGAASYFLCKEAQENDTFSAFIHPGDRFRLPEDPSVDVIMIGPGTGVAPFRAFLQERVATKSSGDNWLFFGERNRAYDFYYEDEWQRFTKEKKLRIDVAFSRDQKEPIYVQHLLLQNAKKIYKKISMGAHIYICGDAKNMAKGVANALQEILQREGNLSKEEAEEKWKSLKKEGICHLDVY